MKKLQYVVGVVLLSAGIGIILANFFPDGFLVSIEAILLIIAGFLIICSK